MKVTSFTGSLRNLDSLRDVSDLEFINPSESKSETRGTISLLIYIFESSSVIFGTLLTYGGVLIFITLLIYGGVLTSNYFFFLYYKAEKSWLLILLKFNDLSFVHFLSNVFKLLELYISSK